MIIIVNSNSTALLLVILENIHAYAIDNTLEFWGRILLQYSFECLQPDWILLRGSKQYVSVVNLLC